MAISLAFAISAVASPPIVAPEIRRLVEGADATGPFEFEVIEEEDGIRDGPDYKGATIYVPKDRQGPLPAVVVVPGFQSREVSIKKWGPFLASHGIIAMTIGTNRLRDFPRERASALLDAIATLRSETVREGSPLQGRVAIDRLGVVGWSMGGGGAQYAASMDPTLAAVVAFCPWHDGAAIEHQAPLLVIAGETDFLARADRHARRHLEVVTESTPRLYFEVRRAGHWVANDPRYARGEVGRAVLAWLKLHLEDDRRFDAVLDVKPSSAVHYERRHVASDAPKSAAKKGDGPETSAVPDASAVEDGD